MKANEVLKIFDKLIRYDESLQCITHAQIGGPIKFRDLKDMIFKVRKYIENEPTPVVWKGMQPCQYAHCAHCDRILFDDEDTPARMLYDFCPKCGRALKW